MPETQESLTRWGDETFGPVKDPIVLMQRIQLEVNELADAVQRCDAPDVGAEAADVVIMMYRLLSLFGRDLHDDLDTKMAVNRARQWSLNGDGTGCHIPASLSDRRQMLTDMEHWKQGGTHKR